MTKPEKIKYLLAPAIGFGIGGALWGWIEGSVLFQGTGIGVILFGLFSIFSLVVLENVKFYKKIVIILIGILFWGIVSLLGGAILFFSSIVFLPGIVIYFLLLWPIVSLFYALALGLLLKIKIWPVFWRGTLGFGLAFTVALVSSELSNWGEITKIFFFILAGIILGLSLGWGLYRGQRLKKIGGRKKEESPEYEKTST